MTVVAIHTAVVPIKSWARSKTRLHPDPAVRLSLARAFAVDVLRAVIDCELVGRVVVVSSEPDIGSLVEAVGATLLDEPAGERPDPLNAAVLHGAGWAADRHPGDPLVVVPADLPALTPESLADALVRARGWVSAFCADSPGTGTTLLVAATPQLLVPAYGYASAQRHHALGAAPLDGVDPRVRRDVDLVDDLHEAVVLGVGRSTQGVLSSLPQGG